MLPHPPRSPLIDPVFTVRTFFRTVEAPRIGVAAVDILTALLRRLANSRKHSAKERLATLLVELWERQRSDDPALNQEFLLPVSQTMLADALGITSVHVSRVLSQIVEDRKSTRLNSSH